MIKAISLLTGIGLVITLLNVLFLKFVIFNLSYGIFFVSILLFVSGAAAHKIALSVFWKVVLISLPSILFALLSVNQANDLWPLVFFVPFITLLGVLFHKYKRVVVPLGLLAIFTFSLYYVPNLLFQSLKESVEKETFDYEFVDLLEDNKTVINGSTKGEVLVLSYFNTWCAPCIEELPELERLKEYYAKDKVSFALVCAGDLDSKESAIAFYEKRNLSLDLWYDENSTVYKRNGFSGVPTTLILDKEGRQVHRHTGYNKGIKLFRQMVNEIDSRLTE